MTATQRDQTFDIMKGIGILLVLLGHVYEWKTIGHLIYSFHMPMFFIVAGYFAKGYDQVADRGATLRGYARRLLPPFLLVAVMNIGWMLFLSVTRHDWTPAIFMGLSYLYSDTTDWATPWGNLHLGITWFLLTLFWAKALFLYLSRWPGWRIVISLVLALVALGVHRLVPHTPWCLVLSLTALPLVSLGYEWRRIQLPVWAICLLVATWVAALIFSRLDMFGYDWGIYPLSLIGACGGTWLLYAFCRLCARHLPAMGRVFAWLGTASLAILCMHDFETTTHMGNHLRVLLGLEFSMEVMYLWRYAITMVLAVACLYLPGVKKLFR
ncbi:MAG: acyltransferase family protein [Bacteroidales bacterium]|nr:acyltransferase family protein [Bacteroidales bacterium]